MSLFLSMVLESVLVSLLYMLLTSFSSPTCLLSIVYFCPLCQREGVHRCVDLSLDFLFCSIDLYFIFVPEPYCLDDFNFVVQSEVRKVDSSRSVLLSQDCFGYLRVFFLIFIYFYFFPFIFISWRLITLQYCFGYSRFFCVSIQIVKLLVAVL